MKRAISDGVSVQSLRMLRLTCWTILDTSVSLQTLKSGKSCVSAGTSPLDIARSTGPPAQPRRVFFFVFPGGADCWIRLFIHVLVRRRRRNRPRKSGHPPLFALSLNVQRDIAHDPNSRFAVLPWCYGPQRSRCPKGPKQGRRGTSIGTLEAGRGHS
jgi:hypothetical protein